MELMIKAALIGSEWWAVALAGCELVAEAWGRDETEARRIVGAVADLPPTTEA